MDTITWTMCNATDKLPPHLGLCSGPDVPDYSTSASTREKKIGPLFRVRQRGDQGYLANARTIAAKSAGLRLAPPTSVPSTSDWAANSDAFVPLTLPPYGTRSAAATSASYASPTTQAMGVIPAARTARTFSFTSSSVS